MSFRQSTCNIKVLTLIALALFFCILPTPVIAQETPHELAQKLNKASRAETLKMFPELEKQGLLGIEEQAILIDGEVKKESRFFCHLPLTTESKAVYYSYKLKTGTGDIRRLAAENLRQHPAQVKAVFEDLLAAGELDKLDEAIGMIFSYAHIGIFADTDAAYCLCWYSGEEKQQVIELPGKLDAIVITTRMALADKQDREPELSDSFDWCLQRGRFEKSGKELIEVFERRLKNAKTEQFKFELKLALTFVRQDVDSFFRMLLDAQSENAFWQTTLGYIEEFRKPEALKSLLGRLPEFKSNAALEDVLPRLRLLAKKHLSQEQCSGLAFEKLRDKESQVLVRRWAACLIAECAGKEAISKLTEMTGAIEEEGLFGEMLSSLSLLAVRHLGPEEKADMALALHNKHGDKVKSWMSDFLMTNAERKLAQRLYDRAKEEKNKEARALYESLALEVTKKYQELERGIGLAGDERTCTPALRWLHFHQDRPSGMWDADGFEKNCDPKYGVHCSGHGASDQDLAATGLAVLAYLGNGHTHRVGLYKKTVKYSLDWLTSQQAENGSFGSKDFQNSIELQAKATMALCEAFAVTRDYKLQLPSQKALNFLLSRRRVDGGWKNGNKKGPSDIVTTAWCVLAMKAAKAARLDLPQRAFKEVLAFLDSRLPTLLKDKSPFQEGKKLTAAAAAAISGIFCGRSRKDKKFVELIEYIDKSHPNWSDKGGPVYWYFGTYAMFMTNGEKWRNWCLDMKRALLPTQRTGGCADGSWNPVGPDAKKLGRVGTTTLNTLTLDIYARYVRANPGK